MTSVQRRNLQLYLRFRGQRMTIAGLLWANRRIYALLVLVFGAFATFLYLAIGSFAAAYVGVAFAVVILRDIGFYRRSAALWPVLEQVLDWSRVEEFVTSPEAPISRSA